MASKSPVDVDKRHVCAVDGALSRDAPRFRRGCFAVHPDRGDRGPSRVGRAQQEDARPLVHSRCRGRAVRAAHGGQFGAGFPLCAGHP